MSLSDLSDAALEAMERRHDAACACPNDGSDPDCNAPPSAVDVARLLAALRAERAARGRVEPSGIAS